MQTILEIIGWVGSLLIVASLMQARVLRFRWMNFIGAVIATAYNAAVGVWPFAFMNFAIAVIDIYWLRRLYAERHDDATYQALAVSTDDAFVRQLLATHERDISEHRPDFDALPLDGHTRRTFLVVRGDEAVGVVAIADRGDGVGEVELDWVKERFRDFTPGEFVYRESGVLADAGFSRLELPVADGQDEAYLTRVGFTRDGGQWVREPSA
ncbi:hypothetical protein ON058_01465 [Demequina sp. B12]|uniref:hypothetical protein n=1 Tax=Demequina sp. B12 TaxID=2992757 RepID=UPI00237AA4A2|nr:hypothetical protein [Demequina sp. B12]MDE0572080.1 hypothetical protein [Demequina sp. B12]